METIVSDNGDTAVSLETRVALLEQAFKNMHTDFRDLRTTITNTAMTVIGVIILTLVTLVGYFGQQKDQALFEIQNTIQRELGRERESNG